VASVSGRTMRLIYILRTVAVRSFMLDPVAIQGPLINACIAGFALATSILAAGSTWSPIVDLYECVGRLRLFRN
jgi:hypothetical protein